MLPQNRLRRRKRLTLGRVILVMIVATAVGLGYLSYYSLALPPGLPFPCSGSEGTVLHEHPYLSITIDGQSVSVPADIGILNSGSCFQPIHTHDSSGIIHVESPTLGTNYTLGEFFQIWAATYHTVNVNGVSQPIVFNSTDVLGFRADSTHSVVLLVDGKPSTAYGSLVLNSLDYCSASTTGPPCSPTAVGNPYYNGQPYPYGTGHTIVIEYTTSPA